MASPPPTHPPSQSHLFHFNSIAFLSNRKWRLRVQMGEQSLISIRVASLHSCPTTSKLLFKWLQPYKSSSPPLSDNLNGEDIGNTSHRKGWRREQEIACRNELGNCQRMYKGNAQGCGSSKVGCLQRGFRATESSMSLSDCKLNLTHFQNNTIQYTLNCIYFWNAKIRQNSTTLQ